MLYDRRCWLLVAREATFSSVRLSSVVVEVLLQIELFMGEETRSA